MNTNTVFKTEESKNEIRSRYNEILSGFPFGQKYIETSFGRTFLLESGTPGSPVLILLHGSCTNSAFWFPEISALSGIFHVLAVDILGEAGNSDENRLDLNAGGYADWLKEILDTLSVKKAAVAGNSLGGWMGLKFATKYPERVSKLILIASAGLSDINADFIDKANEASAKNETMTIDSTVTGGADLPETVVEFMNMILRGFLPIKKELPVFADRLLARLDMPVLFIAGKNDALIHTEPAAQRLRAHVPHAEIHMLENTGHMVLDALKYMIPFLALKD